MLASVARSPCWRTSRRFTHLPYTVPRSTPRPIAPIAPIAFHDTQLRLFTSHGSSWRKHGDGDTAPEKKPASPNSAPAPRLANAEVIQEQKNTQNAKVTKKPDLLSEATVANKEQRKADWAIMKEMAKYLWPKVSSSWVWVVWFG